MTEFGLCRRAMGAALSAVLIAALLVLVPQVRRAVGVTIISSDIAVDAKWTLAGSPYDLAGNRKVLPGVRLSIEPGVVVNLGTGSSPGTLTVQGTVIANGTAVQPITFHKMRIEAFPTSILSFDQGATGPPPGLSLLNHVVVENAGSGSGGRCGYNALNVFAAGRVHIYNSVFQGNSYGALGVASSAIGTTVVNSTFQANGCNGDVHAGEYRGNHFDAADYGSGPDPTKVNLQVLTSVNGLLFEGTVSVGGRGSR